MSDQACSILHACTYIHVHILYVYTYMHNVREIDFMNEREGSKLAAHLAQNMPPRSVQDVVCAFLISPFAFSAFSLSCRERKSRALVSTRRNYEVRVHPQSFSPLSLLPVLPAFSPFIFFYLAQAGEVLRSPAVKRSRNMIQILPSLYRRFYLYANPGTLNGSSRTRAWK